MRTVRLAYIEFMRAKTTTKAKVETHEHNFVSGARANGWNDEFVHSHEGGSVRHQHLHTGPAYYLGSKFTAEPKGEQMPMVPLEEWQKSFTVVITPWNKGFGEGPGTMAAERMIRNFRYPPPTIR